MTAPEVDPDHLKRIVEFANRIGRRPSSNAVIRELKSAGIGVGRDTARKLLLALDRVELEDHWTGPRLTVVPAGETGPADAESTRTEEAPVADRTAESGRSDTAESIGSEVPGPVDQSTGPKVDRADQSVSGPASDHRTDHPESSRETTQSTPSQSREAANSDHQVHFPTVDPDWPVDLHQTTQSARTEPEQVHPDPGTGAAPVHPAESTSAEADAPPVRASRSTESGPAEAAPVRVDQDRDRLPQSTGPAMVAAPSAKAQKLLQSARQASEIRAYQTDPDVIALRAEKIRAWTGRLVWTGLILGLLFTAGNVQNFGAHGAPAWSIPWWMAWVLDPMVSLVLVGLLLAESVTSRYGIETGRWMRAAKWFALAATYAMNTWGAWGSLDPALILLHSVPPGLVFFATEAITDAWDKITEAVNVAVERAARRDGR